MTGFICFTIGFFAGGVIGILCMAAVFVHKYNKFMEHEEEGGF